MNTESVFCEWDELIHIHIKSRLEPQLPVFYRTFYRIIFTVYTQAVTGVVPFQKVHFIYPYKLHISTSKVHIT